MLLLYFSDLDIHIKVSLKVPLGECFGKFLEDRDNDITFHLHRAIFLNA